MDDAIDIVPRTRRCPVPQPGMILVIKPPGAIVGASPLSTLVVCVSAEVVMVTMPAGVVALPRRAWKEEPPGDVLAVFTAMGELLWERPKPPGLVS